MKNIVLERMKLINFKGIKELELQFDAHTQNIYGENGVGKSTIDNGFKWCLFGKDKEGRSDYQIKPTDEYGAEVHNLESTVETWLIVDGTRNELRRVFKEKWTTPRGQSTVRFDGNMTEYYWNDVPMREKDYQLKVSGILEESVFKLLTDPLFFNLGLVSPKMTDWQSRRAVLMEMAGPISERDIAVGNPRFEALLKSMSGKAEKEWRAELGAKKKRLKERLDQIPSRIDEVKRGIPEAVDFDALERQILSKEQQISEVDNALSDIVKASQQGSREQLERQNAINGHRRALQAIEAEIRADHMISKNNRENAIRTTKSNVRTIDGEIGNLLADNRRLEGQKLTLEQRMGALRDEWGKVDASEPNPDTDDYKCPHCRQELPADQKGEKKTTYDTYVNTFNSNKVKRCNEIREEGITFRTQADGHGVTITATEQKIREKTSAKETLLQEILSLEAESIRLNAEGEEAIIRLFAHDADAKDLRLKIADLEDEMTAAQQPQPDNSELKTKRSLLTSDLDALKQQRGRKDQIKCGNDRIEELQGEQRKYAQELADVEQLEFAALDFTKAKIAIVESRINGKFKLATFKLFKEQIDGTEVECCDTMLNGVVFGSLNTGGRLQVGIDIINTLAQHYGVTAPIFLDNRESVFSIPDTESQVINLIALDGVHHLVLDQAEAVSLAAAHRERKKLQIA